MSLSKGSCLFSYLHIIFSDEAGTLSATEYRYRTYIEQHADVADIADVISTKYSAISGSAN